jgi:hypothetical protein
VVSKAKLFKHLRAVPRGRQASVENSRHYVEKFAHQWRVFSQFRQRVQHIEHMFSSPYPLIPAAPE